jgi:hypothetical protein
MSTIICPFCKETAESPVWAAKCESCNVLLFPKVYKDDSVGVDPIYLYVDLKGKYRVELHYEAKQLVILKCVNGNGEHPNNWVYVLNTYSLPPDITPQNVKDKLKVWLTFL